jgi:hypothetical protein
MAIGTSQRRFESDDFAAIFDALAITSVSLKESRDWCLK